MAFVALTALALDAPVTIFLHALPAQSIHSLLTMLQGGNNRIVITKSNYQGHQEKRAFTGLHMFCSGPNMYIDCTQIKHLPNIGCELNRTVNQCQLK